MISRDDSLDSLLLKHITFLKNNERTEPRSSLFFERLDVSSLSVYTCSLLHDLENFTKIGEEKGCFKDTITLSKRRENKKCESIISCLECVINLTLVSKLHREEHRRRGIICFKDTKLREILWESWEDTQHDSIGDHWSSTGFISLVIWTFFFSMISFPFLLFEGSSLDSSFDDFADDLLLSFGLLPSSLRFLQDSLSEGVGNSFVDEQKRRNWQYNRRRVGHSHIYSFCPISSCSFCFLWLLHIFLDIPLGETPEEERSRLE